MLHVKESRWGYLVLISLCVTLSCLLSPWVFPGCRSPIHSPRHAVDLLLVNFQVLAGVSVVQTSLTKESIPTPSEEQTPWPLPWKSSSKQVISNDLCWEPQGGTLGRSGKASWRRWCLKQKNRFQERAWEHFTPSDSFCQSIQSSIFWGLKLLSRACEREG